MNDTQRYSVFGSTSLVATGTAADVVRAAMELRTREPETSVLIFDNETGRQMEFDLSGSVEEAVARVTPSEKPARGRPKLGVDCGEICLLPRHWDWLQAQPRSASATIRRLIDAARKNASEADRRRERIVATDRFLWSLAGDLPNYEDASRALYAEDWDAFRDLTSEWPESVRTHAELMLQHGH